MGGIDKIRGHLAIAILALCLAALAMPAPVHAYDPQNQQVMKDWARQLQADHPEMKTMSDLDKARFVFAQYSQTLKDANAPVNSNAWTRAQQAFGNIDPTRFTCGWHSQNIEATFRALGLKNVHTILADKNSYDILDVNRNHQAVVVVIDGQPYVFDAWKMGVDNNGEYEDAADAASDHYNGMLLETWGDVMADPSNGYVRFTTDSENIEDESNVVWDTDALTSVKRVPWLPTGGNTAIASPAPTMTPVPTAAPAGTGTKTVTLSSDMSQQSAAFTVPAGMKAIGLRVSYDPVQPGFGEVYNVGVGGSDDQPLWQTTLYGEGWGRSGDQKTEVKGSLDNLALPAGDYAFWAYTHQTSPSDSYVTGNAKLTYNLINA